MLVVVEGVEERALEPVRGHYEGVDKEEGNLGVGLGGGRSGFGFAGDGGRGLALGEEEAGAKGEEAGEVEGIDVHFVLRWSCCCCCCWWWWWWW